ncbi:hypothetical protein ACFQ0Q_48615 [Streptomyces aureus]
MGQPGPLLPRWPPSPGLVVVGHLTDRDDITRLADADRVRIQPAS